MNIQDRDIQPVNPNGGQVLNVQLHECASKTVTHVGHILRLQFPLKQACKVVGLVLEVTADGIHDDAHYGFEWHKNHLEEQEGDNCGRPGRDVFGEVKGTEERRRVHESGEACKDAENMELGNKKKFRRVRIIPMSKFVSCCRLGQMHRHLINANKNAYPTRLRPPLACSP
jgi:hypothetical protein